MLIKGLLIAVVVTSTPVAILNSVQDPQDGRDAPTAVVGVRADAVEAAAATLDVSARATDPLRERIAALEAALADCEGRRALQADTEASLQRALAEAQRTRETLALRDAELAEVWSLAESGRHRDNCTPSRVLMTRWTWSRRRGNDEEAAATMDRIVEHHGRKLSELNRLAWNLMTEKPYEGTCDEMALALSEKMLERGNLRHAYLDTAALAFFLNGRVDRAIELQEQAVAKEGGRDDDYARRLRTYRAAQLQAAQLQAAQLQAHQLQAEAASEAAPEGTGERKIND